MSELNLSEREIGDHQGFHSALFLNMNTYDFKYKTPKREMCDSADTSRLSIESTPNAGEKRTSESKFRFCLTNDFLRRLEEGSPAKFQDDVDELEPNECNNDFSLNLKSSLSTIDTTPPAEEESSKIGNCYYPSDTAKKINFDDEEKINSLPFGPSHNLKIGPFTQFYMNNGFMLNPMGNGSNPICNRPGWTCLSCKNFNYETRVKCNRCGKSKVEEKTSNILKVNEPSEKKGSPVLLRPPSVCQSTQPNKKKKPFTERVGDWNCFKCKNLNFSFRTVCNRCQTSKKDSEKNYEDYMKNLIECVKFNELVHGPIYIRREEERTHVN